MEQYRLIVSENYHRDIKISRQKPAPFISYIGKYIFCFYLCTLPDPSPPARLSTSSLVTRLKSPGIVCLSAEAATANSSADLKSFLSQSPQLTPAANESPPPTLSTIGVTWYFFE